MSDLYLSPQMLEEQHQYLVQNFGMNEEEAEEFWEDVRLSVNLTSQEADLDWDKETIDTVTNVLVGIQQQLATRERQRRKHRRRRVLVNLVLHGLFVALAYGAITGYQTDGATLPVLMTGLSTILLYLWLAAGQHIIRVT